MFFSVMTNILNWKDSIKSLVTFKRWDGVNNKKCQYYGSSLKNPELFWEDGVGWLVCGCA